MIAATRAHMPISFVVIYGEVRSEDIDEMRAHYLAIHASGVRLAVVTDARRAHVPSATMRRAMADLTNELEVQTKRNTVCSCVVLDNTLLVGVLTAIRRFVRGELDIRYFARAVDALAYVAGKFRDESLAVPEGALVLAKKLDLAKPGDDLATLVRGDA
jgi:hypothetical protein